MLQFVDHDGRVRMRRYAGQRCLSECVIEQHSGRTPQVMAWGAILCHGRANLLRTKGNLNSDRYVCELLQPEAVPFLQGIPVAIFQQDNARLSVVKTFQDIYSAQRMQLLPWPAFYLVCQLLSTFEISLIGISFVNCSFKRRTWNSFP